MNCVGNGKWEMGEGKRDPRSAKWEAVSFPDIGIRIITAFPEVIRSIKH